MPAGHRRLGDEGVDVSAITTGKAPKVSKAALVTAAELTALLRNLPTDAVDSAAAHATAALSRK